MMKKLMFSSLLLFCCMSLASMNEKIKLEDLRDTDGNPIKPTSTYKVSTTYLEKLSLNHTEYTTKGSSIFDLLDSHTEKNIVFIIKKKHGASIMRSISEYSRRVLRTIGIDVNSDSGSEDDSDSDSAIN